MSMKHLIASCLIVGSLSASAQPASAEHLYERAFFGSINGPSFNIGPSFNDPFNADHKNHPLLLAQQDYLSKAQAIDIARQQTRGKILSAELIRREKRAFYKIKVLTDQGRIKTLRINARR